MTLRNKRLALIPVVLVASLAVAGCARQTNPNVYSGASVGESIRTSSGVIESARFVEIQEYDRLQDNTTGGLIGGVAGGVVGSRFGGGWGKALAVGAGALVGATAGAAAERELKRQQAIEYVVRLDRGGYITVVQGTEPQLRPGTRVFVQEASRGRARVQAAY
jgi:outer membrane lipoprotein SlyB